MFGYIRPVENELLVKEANFYNALYCGLCRYSGKHLSHVSRYFLNYDFTFLALLRLSLSKEVPAAEKKRCPFKLRKKDTVLCEPVFSYVAEAFGVFLYYKNIDDLHDEKGMKKCTRALLHPFIKRIYKKCDSFPQLEDHVRIPLAELTSLEEEGCDSPDRMADCFGRIMKDIASDGLEGSAKAVAEVCGYHIGRFIYLIDAYDDLLSDEAKHRYNPFLKKYGSASEALAHRDSIEQTLSDSMHMFSRTYALICDGTLSGPDRIVFNICDLGSEDAIRRVREKMTKGNSTDDGSLQGT